MTPQQITNAVSEVTGVSVEDMNRKTRKQELVNARQFAQYAIKKLMLKVSFVDIGKAFNQADHCAALNSFTVVSNRIDTEQEWRSNWERLLTKLGISKRDEFTLLQGDYNISVHKQRGQVVLKQESSVIALTNDNLRDLYLSCL